MESHWTVSVINKKCLKNVGYSKFCPCLWTQSLLKNLKAIFLLHYQPLQNTEKEVTIFGKESFILFQIPHSCRHAHLQVKEQPTPGNQAAGILSQGREVPQWVPPNKVHTARSQNTYLMSQKFKYIQISWNNCKWPLQLCAGKGQQATVHGS